MKKNIAEDMLLHEDSHDGVKTHSDRISHKTLEQRVKESGIPLRSNEEYDFGEAVGLEYW